MLVAYVVQYDGPRDGGMPFSQFVEQVTDFLGVDISIVNDADELI
jgi:hypothetical protein